ncbi:hypothetical protein B566_EDAN007554 [Ephemera danica]|nr:hypothetical protein B566_EDAN007554 [Ephemera danica]
MANDLILVLLLSMLCCSQMQITNAIVPGACKAWQYRCQNGECIDLFLLCDGGPDCRDGSDELKCGSQVNKAHPFFFRCRGNGRIVASYKRCDGNNNCFDESDEWNCPKSGQCKSMQYRCNDGTCISAQTVCDKKIDCSDGSDELFCLRLQNLVNCTGEFTCDNAIDHDEFQCENGRCVPKEARCDGLLHCVDASDEWECTDYTTICKADASYTAAVTMSATSGERTALILALVVIMVILVLFVIIIYLGAKHLRRLKEYQMNPRVSLSRPGKSSPPRELM